ncbi:hypothetical protein CAMSH0001_2053 [Campylobacter showae RM3277]|uniref:Uncharacterized protein n=1 Tax=Campylobacter showae RM3277 TaxID=553219 RepID=C6REG2_9BACT|nr:hypothetical protein CAMSH0001_2053 [Campylobacter showae RM3277]
MTNNVTIIYLGKSFLDFKNLGGFKRKKGLSPQGLRSRIN